MWDFKGGSCAIPVRTGSIITKYECGRRADLGQGHRKTLLMGTGHCSLSINVCAIYSDIRNLMWLRLSKKRAQKVKLEREKKSNMMPTHNICALAL